MQIPLAYNLRNLAVRHTTTLLTALGIALTVAVLLSVLALVAGLRQGFEASGHPLHLLVMRKGATAELTSILSRETFQQLRLRPGIARGRDGEPQASLEMVTGLTLNNSGKTNTMNLVLRGISPVGVEMRSPIRFVQGRMFVPGKREAVVGSSIAKRYPEAAFGKILKFGRGEWEVVGIFEADHAASNSEVWVDLNQAAPAYSRQNALSSVLLRAADEVALRAMQNELPQDVSLNVLAQPERSYYAAQMVSALPVQAMGTFVAILLAIGSSFAAMNTMYAAVARRSPEIGTLRVLGFSRASVLTSFLLESLLLSLLGGIIGCVLVLPLDGFTTAIGSFITFSEFVFQFRISPDLLLLGLAFALVMGVLGGLLPAWHAARKDPLSALRS